MARVIILEGVTREINLQSRVSLASSGIAVRMADRYGWSPLTMYLQPSEARLMAETLTKHAETAEKLGGKHGT